jgi:hypothetical protein
VIGRLLRSRISLTEGFFSGVDLLGGESSPASVGLLAPFEPMNESSTVACFGKTFDAASKLLDQGFFAWVVLQAADFIEVIAESANMKRNSQEDAADGTQT